MDREFYPPDTFEVCRDLAKDSPALCSNFYLLYEIVKNRGVKEFEFDYRLLRDQLDYAFQRYTLYACARESRHIYTEVAFDPDCVEEMEDDFPDATEIASRVYGSYSDPVMVARLVFRTIKNAKSDILGYCYDLAEIFGNIGWGSAYGGKSWAKITVNLIQRLEGERSKTVFIDTCWHLQHNSNIYLNKLIHLDSTLFGLKKVLKAKLEGDFSTLTKYSDLPNRIKYAVKPAQLI